MWPVTTSTVATRRTTALRRVPLAGLEAAAALCHSACQITSPVTTDMPYDPADGVSVDVGDVAVRDLLVVSEGDGAPGVVSGLVVNNSSESVEVTLAVNVEGQMSALSPVATVPAGGAVRLDGQGTESGSPVTLPSVPVGAGGTLDIVVQTSVGQAEGSLVPVLLPEAPYADHVATTADTPN